MTIFLDKIKKKSSVATVTSIKDLEFLKGVAAKGLRDIADLFEFRLDNFSIDGELDSLENFLSTFSPPVILTPRHPSEGGTEPKFESNDIRSKIIERFQLRASAIDIEMEHLESVLKKISISVPIIGSAHNFRAALSRDTILEKVKYCQMNGVTVPKFAMTLNSITSLTDLVTTTDMIMSTQQPISVMGMGSYGKISRLVLAKAGSCLNYGYLQEENAPGQWPAMKLKELISEL